jgi:hypothetical protein
VGEAASPARSVEPLVLIDGERIVVCGAAATFDVGGGTASLSVALERKEQGADLVVRGRWREADGKPLLIERLTLATASTKASEVVSRRAAEPDGTLALSGPAASPSVTILIQEFMVSGARATFESAGREPLAFIIPGPLPQSTRAAYLNCAGDLYRPGE